MGNFIDLTNMVFGKLTVLERVEDYISPKGRHDARWKCMCSCDEHNIIIVRGSSLRNGHTKSCGHCKNHWEFDGDIAIGYTFEGEVFKISIEDYNKCKDICWYSNGNGYIRGNYNGKDILLHRYILGIHNNDFSYYKNVVDHKNRNPKDNRKENLKICSTKENNSNKSIYSNSKSGVKGIYWNKKLHKWSVEIKIKDRRVYLGLFKNKEEAIKAQEEAYNEIKERKDDED